MSLSLLLENAILNLNPTERQQAEAELKNLAESNWVQYLGLLSEILSDESQRTEIRMLAGLNVKNELTSKDNIVRQQQIEKWCQLDPILKDQIKSLALNTLLTTDERVANQAASLVSAIAEIELPRDEWPTLIDIIVENTKTEKPVHVKRSSLLTIGYICESLDPTNEIVSSYSNGILIAIVQGAQSSESSIIVRKTALNALINSLEFIESNFSREGERNYIMQVVCEASTSDDKELQALSFAALAKIMSLYYDFMGIYMEKALYSLTVNGMKSSDDRVACNAVEFWSTVCEVELEIQINKDSSENPDDEICFNFALIAISDVLPVLLSLLTKQNDDFEDDDWTVSMAAATCLQLFAQDTTNYVVRPTLEFVESNLSSNDWKHREAAVMAFGSILDGPDRSELKILIGQALPPIFALIQDKNLQVKDTVSWCLGRIAELVIDAIDTNTMLSPIMGALVEGLKDHPKIATNCCWTIINLTDQLCSEDSKNSPSNLLTPYFPTVIPALLGVSNKPDNEHSSRTSAYEALSIFVERSSQTDMSLVTLIANEAMQRLDQTIIQQQGFQDGSIPSNGESKALLEELQSNILSLLTHVIRRVGSDISGSAEELMTKFLSLLQIQTDDSIIEEDIFMGIAAVAAAIGENFQHFMPAFLPFLTKALENTESPICESAIGLVVDISHSLGLSFIPYCQGFMTVLGTIITNVNSRRDLKPLILSCFGDIASSIGIQFTQYLNDVMNICMSAQSIEPSDDSYETEDFILHLQESVLDAYVGIVAGLHDQPQPLSQFLPQIFNFLTLVYGSPTLSNNDHIYRAAAGLLGDIAQIYQGQKLEYYKQSWISIFLRKAKNNPKYSQSSRDTAKWAREQQKVMLANF